MDSAVTLHAAEGAAHFDLRGWKSYLSPKKPRTNMMMTTRPTM